MLKNFIDYTISTVSNFNKSLCSISLAVLISKNITSCDASEPWQIGMQDPATPIMEGMIFFHNYLLFFLIAIGIMVLFLVQAIVFNFNSTVNPFPRKFTHSSILEIVWTILPAILLVLIAIPSFSLLYSLDELVDPALTLKVIGHQWYWSYEFSDYETLDEGKLIGFDSYMTAENDLELGSFRLLETDNRIKLPTNTHVRVLVTAADVLHSWAIPSLGLKIDACPGRLSQASIFLKREGVFYGQCSEICGVNHGFMPIVISAITPQEFKSWVISELAQ